MRRLMRPSVMMETIRITPLAAGTDEPTASQAAAEPVPGLTAPAAPTTSAPVKAPVAATPSPGRTVVLETASPNGSTDMDLARTTLSVTFDRPMDP